MPQPFERAVMTRDGEDLLTKAAAGDCKIEYVRIAIGNGDYTHEEKAVSALKERKTLKSEKNSYAFSNVSIENEKCIMLTALLTNQDPLTLETLVTAGYYINEVGIFAREAGEESDQEVLYSICVTASETGNGDYMPPYNGENRAEITQDYIISVDNSAEIMVNVKGTYFLAEDAINHIYDNERHITAEERTRWDRQKVKIGAADTALEAGDTLFVVEDEFTGAVYSNLTLSADEPETDNWGMIEGDLVVSAETPADATFFAEISE